MFGSVAPWACAQERADHLFGESAVAVCERALLLGGEVEADAAAGVDVGEHVVEVRRFQARHHRALLFVATPVRDVAGTRPLHAETRRYQRVPVMGGTGLEPVTPSLSIRPDVASGCVMACSKRFSSGGRG